MYSDKNKYTGDAGYVAEELLKGISELDSKCLVIQKTVEDGDFSLEEALQLYEVSEKDYEAYIMKHVKGEIEVAINAIKNISGSSICVLMLVDILKDTYLKFISPVDKESRIVINHLDDLPKKIATGRM